MVGRVYCKQYGPISDCSSGSSLISVHIDCFQVKIYSEVHLNIRSRYFEKANIFRTKDSGVLSINSGLTLPLAIVAICY